MSVFPWIIALSAAYLLGAIPFGYLLVRWRTGRDVRSRGSGNIGATNVLRTTGKGWGILTLFLDALKGALAVWLAGRLVPGSSAAVYLAGLAAVLGHIFPVFLHFRGGKGVATCLGVFLVLSPMAVLLCFGVFILLMLLTRMVSAGSIGASLAFPPAAWWFDSLGGIPLTAALACSLAVVAAHHENIVRILGGREKKMWGAGSTRPGEVTEKEE